MSKQIISRGLYVEGLRKIKIPSIIFASLIAVMQFVIPVAEAIAARNMYSVNTLPARAVVGTTDFTGFLLMLPLVMVPILTLIEFFAFDKRSSSDFYLSLPYTRKCLFFSWFGAVLTIGAALVIIGTALGIIARVMFPELYIVSLNGLGDVMLSLFVAMLFGMACVTMAISVTGTFISNACCTLLIMFFPRLLLYLIRLLLLNGCPLIVERYFLPWMGARFNVFVSSFVDLFFTAIGPSYAGQGTGNIEADIFTLLLAVIYIFLSVLLFIYRKSETAGQSSTSRTVQNIIRMAITLAFFLLGTYCMRESSSDIFGVMVFAIGLILFFAYEIITTKKWKNLVRILPSLAIVIAIDILVWVGAAAGSKVINSAYMKVDDVASIRMNDLTDNIYGEDAYFQDTLNNIDIKDKQIIEMAVNNYNDEVDSLKRGDYYTNSYTEIVNGAPVQYYKRTAEVSFKVGAKDVYRNVRFTNEQINDIVEAISKDSESVAAILKLPEPNYSTFTVSFGPKYGSDLLQTVEAGIAQDILATLQEEIYEGGLRAWVDAQEVSVSNECVIGISYYDKSAENRLVELRISQERFAKTYIKALNLLRENQDIGRLQTFIDNLDAIREKQLWYSITVYICDKNSAGQYIYNEDGEILGDDTDLKDVIQAALDSPNDIEDGKWMIVEYYCEGIADGSEDDSSTGELESVWGRAILPFTGRSSGNDLPKGL